MFTNPKEEVMEALSKINLPELAQQPSVEISLTKPSGISRELGLALILLLKQAKDGFPNQELLKGTQEMYLAQWEEMTLQYGVTAFREGLWKAIRSSEFFPVPDTIRAYCRDIRNSELDRASGLKAIREHDAMKAQWLKERAERTE